MSCSEAGDRVIDCVEGLLSQEDKRLFDQHLASCDDCRAHFTAYCALVDLLHQERNHLKALVAGQPRIV